MVDEKLIIGFLKRNQKQLFSAKEIAEVLERTTERGVKSMQAQMKKLVKFNVIRSENINRMVASRIFGTNYKRGLTLYFYEQEL